VVWKNNFFHVNPRDSRAIYADAPFEVLQQQTQRVPSFSSAALPFY
jgi:hypothetical protein